jgi:serine/threonine-protein kinase
MNGAGGPGESQGALAPGATIAHFEIIKRLGHGGMGEVYLARDRRLERNVALKVLPAATLGDREARARLEREARLVSALNHPNICTVHEVGEDGGRAFIAMEFVEGRTLDQVIPPHGLPAESVARIGAAIAAALAYAHRQGIVHRDLKSGNVMITLDGRVKVMDFGLARRPAGPGVAATGSETALTTTGMLVGSPQTMSPEVLQGGDADARSDLWALGVVLFEMCTGALPFQGRTAIELGAAILNAEPAPLPASVTGPLRLVIQRCLSKDPASRFQLADEARAVLEAALAGGGGVAPPAAGLTATAPAAARPARRRRAALVATFAIVIGALAIVLALDVGGVRHLLRPSPSAGRIRSLAVLPLQNLSRDPEQEYFADGMTEELIASLASLQGVSVISRTSVMKYKGTQKSLPQIAKELGVDGVIEGSAMNAEGKVRVTAQLIEAADDRHLWANHYERDLKDVLALQDEVARAIAGEIQVALTPAPGIPASAPRVVVPEAYEACLKGRFLWNRRTRQDLEAAVVQLKHATELDTNYAEAYSALALAYVLAPDYAAWPVAKASPLARAAAERALALDGGRSGAYTALAQARIMFDWDWTGAGAAFERALQLNPNDATAHQWYSNYLNYAGRPDAGYHQMELARRVDPQSMIIRCAQAEWLIGAGRYAEADSVLAEVKRLDPAFPNLYLESFFLAAQQRDFKRAAAEHGQFVAMIGGGPGAADDLTRAYRSGGERGFWSALLAATDTTRARLKTPLGANAFIYVKLGEFDRALDLLERLVAAHDSVAPGLMAEYGWAPLRALPRFQALVKRVGIPG